MPFLGLDALQWFVALDVGVLIGSGATAAALFVKLQQKQREKRRLEELGAPPTDS